MRVEVLDETGRFRSHEVLARSLSALGGELGVGEGREVTVIFVDDDIMARRNLEHRGVPGATDVLAYPLHEPDDAGVPVVPALGDIVISLDTAERQAAEHALQPWQEALVLAAHALVHLLGFDHRDQQEWRPFRAAQARVLELAAAAGVERAGGVVATKTARGPDGGEDG